MTEQGQDLLLPPRARLLHIGLSKTGTTALQSAAHALRPTLLEHGVRYPGRTVNQGEASLGILGRKFGWSGPGAPRPSAALWQEMVEEIEADRDNRILVSSEFLSRADDEEARRILDTLGGRTHVVVTLRGLGSLLASNWQQYVKLGLDLPFEEWLERVLGDSPDPKVSRAFQHRKDQGSVVRRWAELVGPDNVTAVIVDKQQPDLLAHTFEQLLGLPTDLLASAMDRGSRRANRTMSLPEAELVRRVNETFRGKRIEYHYHRALLRRGGITRLLRGRQPGADEPSIPVPAWAATRAEEYGRRSAEAIGNSGVRVVGRLEELYAPVASRESVPVEAVPLDAAVELAAGIFSAATGRGATYRRSAGGAKRGGRPTGRTSAGQTAEARAAGTFTARQLAGALRLKVGRRLRRRR